MFRPDRTISVLFCGDGADFRRQPFKPHSHQECNALKKSDFVSATVLTLSLVAIASTAATQSQVQRISEHRYADQVHRQAASRTRPDPLSVQRPARID
jgi:hypothetical protein